MVAALLLVAQWCPAAFGQSNSPAPSSPAAPPHLSSTPVLPRSAAQATPASSQSATPAAGASSNPVSPTNSTDCFGGNCDDQPPHISIATPAPAPAPWPWQERISWGANVVLVVLGYIAILIALSLLRKIERQTRYGEATAEAAQESARAAQESAQAALLHAQAALRAERPWILMNVRPSQTVDNGFSVMATNRGHSPALILSTVDEIVSAVDEAHLAAQPEYRSEPAAPEAPLILLPGETTELLSFSRADVKRICETEERLARIEKWEEKIFLYGTVTYRDLAATEEAPAHQSSWFCWYIHGRQKSGMVMAGPRAYNKHT